VRQPCLLDWLHGHHTAIVYEEATWELVWDNRMLMQSGPVALRMGQSPTNQSSYEVNVYGAPMIVTSNDFWQGCTNRAAKDWIEANSFYRWIDTPQWETEC
jgi:hypothetical protein